MKLYFISNRLPVKIVKEDGKFHITRSEGGLATGLASLEDNYEKHWIGWPGIYVETEEEQEEIRVLLEEMNFHPVFLNKEQLRDYYEGYSNSTIWPLCHYFFVYTTYKNKYWESYKEVNKLFYKEASKFITSKDLVWVHDYHLMLLPRMIRRNFGTIRIGYFHHIPCPSYELFRILPERAEILRGLLGADVIAFHTHSYMRHFISAVERVLHINFNLDEAQLPNRIVRINAFPMGINYKLYNETPLQPETQAAIEKTTELYDGYKMVLSVDRLDYSKGLLHRLSAINNFLRHHKEYHEKVIFVMVIVPSRDRVGSYADLKNKVNEEIGAINGKYSTVHWTPISYFYHSLEFKDLVALYNVADVALVNSLRDGMNLVAKEFVAAKRNKPGVLILSEMAGASVELTDALLINPNDIGQVEDKLFEALEMPEKEQRKRLIRMQKVVSVQTVNKWAADFVKELKEVSAINQGILSKQVTPESFEEIREKYQKAEKRLILLDYDGTLVPLRKRPEDAKPTPQLKDLLKLLLYDYKNNVVINSGRSHAVLDEWLGDLPLSMAAEHGVFYKEQGVWYNNKPKVEWSDKLLELLDLFVEKTPGSRLEVKKTALAWHYRECDSWLAALRSQQLKNAIYNICSQENLQLLQGSKVIEIKSADFTKGAEVKRLLSKQSYDFILSMGDDTTDEDMFEALPDDAITIKVNGASEHAAYSLSSQSDVLSFLKRINEHK